METLANEQDVPVAQANQAEMQKYNVYARVFRFVLAGAVTSEIGGLLMASFMMLVFILFKNQNGLYFFQVIGSIVFGQEALVGSHIGAVVLGVLLHFGPLCLTWGIFYGIIAARFKVISFPSCLAMGILFGILSMIIDSYFVAPPVLHSLYGSDIWNQNITKFSDWVAHIIFGASFGFFPWTLHFMLDERHIHKKATYP